MDQSQDEELIAFGVLQPSSASLTTDLQPQEVLALLLTLTIAFTSVTQTYRSVWSVSISMCPVDSRDEAPAHADFTDNSR